MVGAIGGRHSGGRNVGMLVWLFPEAEASCGRSVESRAGTWSAPALGSIV